MMISADVLSDESYSGDCHQPWAQLTKHVEKGEGGTVHIIKNVTVGTTAMLGGWGIASTL